MRTIRVGLACVVGIAFGACFADPPTVGAACSTDADCGDLVCVDGACAEPGADTGGADATAGSGDTTSGGSSGDTSGSASDDGVVDTSSDDGIPETCGNGQTDPGEDCDDDNDEPFDGCDQCSLSPSLELDVVEDLGGLDRVHDIAIRNDAMEAAFVGSILASDRELFAARLNLESGAFDVSAFTNAPTTKNDEVLHTVTYSPEGLTAGGFQDGTKATSSRLLLRWVPGDDTVDEITFLTGMGPGTEQIRAAAYDPASTNVVVAGATVTDRALRGFVIEVDPGGALVNSEQLYETGYGDTSTIHDIAAGGNVITLAGTFLESGGGSRGFTVPYQAGDPGTPTFFGPAAVGSEARAVASTAGTVAAAGLLIAPDGGRNAHVEIRSGGAPMGWTFDEGPSVFNDVALRSNGGVVAVGSLDSDILLAVLDDQMQPVDVIVLDMGGEDEAVAIERVGQPFVVAGTADGDALIQIWTFPS